MVKKRKKEKKGQGQGRHVGTMLFWPVCVHVYMCVSIHTRHDTHLSLQLSHYCQVNPNLGYLSVAICVLHVYDACCGSHRSQKSLLQNALSAKLCVYEEGSKEIPGIIQLYINNKIIILSVIPF